MFTDVSELIDRKIMVVGLGRTGVSLAHFLSRHQAKVTITDHKSRAELSEALEQMKELEVEYDLGDTHLRNFWNKILLF